MDEETPVPVPEYVTPDAVVPVGAGARTPLEPKTPLGPVIPSVADEGERTGSKIDERPKERVGRTIRGGCEDETPEAVVAAAVLAALDGGAWPRVVVTPLLTTTVLEMMTVLTTPGATDATEATDATGAPVSGAEPPVKWPRRSPRRSRFVDSTELDVLLEISRFTCRGK